jgi:hypothetical protein
MSEISENCFFVETGAALKIRSSQVGKKWESSYFFDRGGEKGKTVSYIK